MKVAGENLVVTPLNRLLKKICEKAGLNENVEIVETNGGSPKRVPKKKWELVHTHTARRTGATLMYLSGMDVYDIMKITDKYDYFD